MIRSRKARLSAGIVLGVATLITPLAAVSGPASAAPSTPAGFVALANSVSPTTDTITGGYSSSHMKIEVALAPSDPAGLNSVLGGLYTKGSASYQKWLAPGQFDARYAPPAAARSAVSSFLSGTGLTVTPSSSPFLVRASGTSAQVSGAFHTTLSTFKDPHGVQYFSNSTPVSVPSTLAGDVMGVIGLSNTSATSRALCVSITRSAR